MNELQSEIKSIIQLHEIGDESAFRAKLNSIHPADIAEIIQETDNTLTDVIVSLLTDENLAETLVEIDRPTFKQIVPKIDSTTIAKRLIPHLESDDATDLLEDLSEDKRLEIITQLGDSKSSNRIIKLLNYPEDSAGGLMATELVHVNLKMNIRQAVRSIRTQAVGLENVSAIYVIDDNRRLQGLISLRKFLTRPPDTLIEGLYASKNIISVKATASFSEVLRQMKKYDLLTLPVVSENNTLLGRITMDDVLEHFQEDTKKGMKLFSGITGDISLNDNALKVMKARVPWLIIGLIGGLFAASVIGIFEQELQIYPEMIIYIPLIAAMAGNVGIQSSSIVVQAIANDQEQVGKVLSLLAKELLIGLLSGLILGILIFLFCYFITTRSLAIAVVTSASLLFVVVFASIFGTFVPLVLNRFKINPALSTGPFITTTNDVIGLYIYFQMIGISEWF